jgi:bacterioferritin-associated ferredoxin
MAPKRNPDKGLLKVGPSTQYEQLVSNLASGAFCPVCEPQARGVVEAAVKYGGLASQEVAANIINMNVSDGFCALTRIERMGLSATLARVTSI